MSDVIQPVKTPTDFPINRFMAPSTAIAAWVIAGLLAAIALRLWIFPAQPAGLAMGSFERLALAQNVPGAGARGVYAFPAQLDNQQWGMFMMDVDQGTFWVYGIEDVNGTAKLKLLAARSWIYDRYLQDYNCEQPGFRQVQELISIQRAQPADRKNRPADAPDELPPAEGAPGGGKP